MTGLTEKLNVPFIIDNKSFEHTDMVLRGLRRSFSVADGKNGGRDLAGGMIRDIIGTYFNYSLDFGSKSFNPEAYEQLVELLSAPVPFHTVSFPFGNQTITQRMYVTNGEDTLKWFNKSGDNQFSDLSINFIAMKPFLKP